MRKMNVFLPATLAVLLMLVPILHAQQDDQKTTDQRPIQGMTNPERMGPAMTGPYGGYPDSDWYYQDQDNWNYCPYCGNSMGRGYHHGYGMGPGRMGMRHRYGQGRGMMNGRGMMMGPGWGRSYGPDYDRRQSPLAKDDAEYMVKKYLKSSRNPNLKIGNLEDKGDDFQADIVTKDGSLVDQLLIDKDTGWMRSVY